MHNKERKGIGLLGGMGWTSTQNYYFLLNKEVEQSPGLTHSAKYVIYSYDFDSINPNCCNSEELIFQLENGVSAFLEASANVRLLRSNAAHKSMDTFKEKYVPGLFFDIGNCTGSFL